MNKSEIIAQAAEYLDVFTSKMEKMPDTANVKRLVAELYAIAASAGDAPAVQGEPVGEVRFEFGVPSLVYAELYSETLPSLEPGTKLYGAPQPAEQQPAPDVEGLVDSVGEGVPDYINDAIDNLEYDNYELSYAGYLERKRDAELIRAHIARTGQLAAAQSENEALWAMVEALEFARDDLQEWMKSFPDVLHDPTVKNIERIDAALAAHRKPGGES